MERYCVPTSFLPVEFSRVDAGEKGFDECFKGDLCRVIENFNGFCVTGRAGAHIFVARVFGGAAGKTGYGVADPEQALEDDLGVPEAAFGEVGGLFIGGRWARVFGGDGHLGLTAGYHEEDGAEGEEETFHI